MAIDNLSGVNAATIQLREEISDLKLALKEKEAAMGELIQKKEMGQTILKEINALFPQIESCIYAETPRFHQKNLESTLAAIVLFSINQEQTLTPDEKMKIERWVKTKVDIQQVRIFYE